MTLEEFVRLLDERGLRPKQTGAGQWAALCPSHQDRIPSLSVGAGNEGRVLLNCHVGCAIDEILGTLGLSKPDLFASPNGGGRSEQAVEYIYLGRDGKPVMKVVKKPGKRFSQARPDGEDGWLWNLQGVDRVLYRLPEVLAAVAAGERIYIAEGEKDVHALEGAGVVATTNPGGAGKWRSEYSEALAGADVVVIADRDEPGRRHAEEVAKSLTQRGCAVRIVQAAEGKDAHDHLAAGLGVEDLKGLAGAGPAPPLDLAATLDMAEAYLRRYTALTEAQYIAVTLWIAHAHALDATSTTPYLHVTSPEAESGKSRLLECLEPLTPQPIYAASMTPAVLFRAVQKLAPTLLVDEADNLMRDREAKSELLGLLNAGYRRGALAYRIGGGNRDELKSFETFCAKVIAGLDDLVATLASRCLRIEMQRRRVDESIEDFYREEAHAEAEPIRDALASWAAQATDQLRRARPDRLGVRDRLEEALRLLVAIGEMAGERWGARARAALHELAGPSTPPAMSERTQLLIDIRHVFEEHCRPAELASADLLDGLMGLVESPWRGWWGVEERQDNEVQVRPSRGAGRKLSEKLRAFKIRSHNTGDARRKGYRLADFEDSWGRYLPATPATGDPYPLNPLKPRAQAKNDPSTPAHCEDLRADSDRPQLRIPEPNERNERKEAAQCEDDGESRPLVDAALDLFGGDGS